MLPVAIFVVVMKRMVITIMMTRMMMAMKIVML